jgi:site-specific DNA recombinase
MTIRIGAYQRISLDWEGEGLGVARQRADATKLAALKNWDIAEFYTDNNISAFKSSVLRPEFERMLSDLASGQIDGIVAYDLDRIARQPVDLERIIRLYEQRAGLVFATVQGSIDLSTSDGLTMARVMVTFANKSSMDTSRRTKRKNLDRAEMGLPHGGHRPYGYLADLLTLHPVEAPLLREMGGKLIAGDSYKDIAYWMNEHDYPTTTGKLWYPITVRNTLRRERYAAVRTHLGLIYRGHDSWQPVFSTSSNVAARMPVVGQWLASTC